MHPDGLRRVRLTGVPTTLYVQLHVHIDDLLREVTLMNTIDGDHGYGLAPYWHPALEQAQAAERAGREHVDIEFQVPADAAERLSALFAQADAFGRTGLLLTADMPAALRPLRDRLVDELSRQLQDGDEP